MKKTYFLSLIVFFICLQLEVFSQPWTPDAITSAFDYKKAENGKYRLMRALGDGRIDSSSRTYDVIYKFNDRLSKPGYLGRIDSSWYLLDFDKAPFLIPAEKYVGQGFFITKKGNAFEVYSVKEKKIIIKDLVKYNVYIKYTLSMDTSTRSIDVLRPDESDYLNKRWGNDVFWVETSKGVVYRLSTSGDFYLERTSLFKKKGATKPTYGLSGYGNTLVPAIYDSIYQYGSVTFGKEGMKYDAYNILMEKIAENQEDFECFTSDYDLVKLKEKGKFGLRSLLGEQILAPTFDSLWIDKLIIAYRNDSVLFYDMNKLINAVPKKKNVVYKVNGDYESLPLFISEAAGEVEKTFFVYNPFTGSVLNTMEFEGLYLFGIVKGNYLLTAKKSDKYGVVDLNGKIFLPFEYDYISPGLMEDYWVFNRLYAIRKNGKTGIVGSDLKAVVPMEYDGIGTFNLESRLIPARFSLKKGNQYHLIDWKTKKVSEYGYDTIRVHKYSYGWGSQTPNSYEAVKDGIVYLIDSTGRKYFDFKNVHAQGNGDYVILEENQLNKIPVNLTPLASINNVEELNSEHNYAIVYCLNRYFIVNKYAEMSTGFESYPEVYYHEEQLVFGRKTKKGPVALWDMKGNEVGKTSKYKMAYTIHDQKTNECYYVFIDSKKRHGLMNMKGELLLECKYADIVSINDGKCTVSKVTKEEAQVDLKKLTPLKWEK